MDGTLCLLCVLFRNKTEAYTGKFQKLLSSPPRDWVSAKRRFHEHSLKSDIHKASLVEMQRFKNVMEQKATPIDVTINSSLSKRVQNNRKKLKPIVKTVIFCGRQNIPLRGHCDDSRYDSSGKANFQALLDFRVDSGEEILADYFATAKSNATYCSKCI